MELLLAAVLLLWLFGMFENAFIVVFKLIGMVGVPLIILVLMSLLAATM